MWYINSHLPYQSIPLFIFGKVTSGVGIARRTEGTQRSGAPLSCVNLWTHRSDTWRLREHVQWLQMSADHYGVVSVGFYSSSALLAMQSAVLATGILSVCLSVRLSVTFRYCVQMNEDTIVRFSASGRTISLVSGEVKFIRIFAGDHHQRGR